jgi:hypothetical protein
MKQAFSLQMKKRAMNPGRLPWAEMTAGLWPEDERGHFQGEA